MHVMVFVPFVHWPTHFATDLELVQRHLDYGDQVTLLVCNGDLPSCDVNPDHDVFRCRDCAVVRNVGISTLSERVSVQTIASFFSGPLPQCPEFSNQQELREFTFDGFDAGLAALSSLIFILRDADPDLREHRRLLRELVDTSIRVFSATRKYLEGTRVDRCYVFNTRFASTRGVMRACAAAAVPCFVHERGCDLGHFEVFPDTFPHDRAFVDRDIRARWRAAESRDEERRAIAASWYERKAVGIENYQVSFVAGQRLGYLPERWDRRIHNIVVFTSSEDEYAAIGDEWVSPIYSSELTGVLAMVEAMSSVCSRLDRRAHLYVRVHPNLSGVDNRQTRGLRTLEGASVTVIEPGSPVSTYALLRAAATVITFGSTTGIEATYWGIPSILAGMSFYRDLGATYNPASHDALVSLMGTCLTPREREPALMYGFYQATFGTAFKYYRARNFDTGEFRGRDLWTHVED